MKILLVEDNELIIKGLKYSFEKNNYEFYFETTIENSVKFLKNNRVDLIILDIMLPDGKGTELYENIIKNECIPTIFLTAEDDEDVIVKCLNSGADDYMRKPFSTNELLARVNKILNKNTNNIKIKNLLFDINKMLLYKDNEIIDLSPLELKLVYLLFINKGKVINRNIFLDKILDITGNFVDDHTLTVYFKRIREKIGEDIIKTVKGIGYIIDEE